MTYDLQQLNFKVNIQSKKKRYSYNFYINPKQFTYDSLKLKKKKFTFLVFFPCVCIQENPTSTTNNCPFLTKCEKQREKRSQDNITLLASFIRQRTSCLPARTKGKSFKIQKIWDSPKSWSKLQMHCSRTCPRQEFWKIN